MVADFAQAVDGAEGQVAADLGGDDGGGGGGGGGGSYGVVVGSKEKEKVVPAMAMHVVETVMIRVMAVVLPVEMDARCCALKCVVSLSESGG